MAAKKEKNENTAMMHKMPNGHMMKNSEMKKITKKKKTLTTSDGYMSKK